MPNNDKLDTVKSALLRDFHLVDGRDYAIVHANKEYHLLASEECAHLVCEAAAQMFQFRSLHTYPAAGGLQPIE